MSEQVVAIDLGGNRKKVDVGPGADGMAMDPGRTIMVTRASKDRRNTIGSKFVDLSHVIEHGQVTYKGLPAPLISDYLSRRESRKFYGKNTEFHIGRIEMIANTGTYLDSPFHRFAKGTDLARLPLQKLANLDAICVRPDPEDRAICINTFQGFEVKGKAILIHTGWSRHWRKPKYFTGHPFLTATAAQYLAEQAAVLVGIDSYNIDDTSDSLRPAHTTLLASGIPIVEHITNLQELPRFGFKFFAVPVKIKNFGTFPVRAFALV